ncbi:MAG: tetratricopeptide repeat protein [Bacteroidales bacterium]|nr:tetratricopeptide repeat protein [Bacteroidales bacterium]
MKDILIIFGLIVTLSTFGQRNNELVIDAYGKLTNGKYSEAVAAFDKALSESRDINSNWVLYRGIAKLRNGDDNAAKSDFETALQLKNNEGYLWLSRIYASRGNTVKSVSHLEKYLNNLKYPDLNKIKKDSAFIILHGTDEWFDLWQNDWLNMEQKLKQETEFYLKKGDFRSAHKTVESAESYMGSAFLIVFNSEIYLEEGIPGLALNEINKALQLEPHNLEILKKKADYLTELRKYEEAELIYEKILDITPEDFDIRKRRINNALQTENLSLAQKDIKILLTCFENADILYLAGNVNYAAGNYLEALKIYNRLINQKEPSAELYRARGLTYYNTGTFKFAAYDLSMSLDLEPDNIDANLYLGLSEYQMGNTKSACYYLKRAKAFGSNKADEYLERYCK